MSARKNQSRNRRSGGGGDQPRAGGGNQRGGNQQRRTNNRRNRGRSRNQPDPVAFWGDPAQLPATRTDIQITDDPAAVPRSLGTPPLPGQEQIAAHYFAVVYDRAVTTAGALAAAGGLIDPEGLTADDED
jgi:hypothetical protein